MYASSLNKKWTRSCRKESVGQSQIQKLSRFTLTVALSTLAWSRRMIAEKSGRSSGFSIQHWSIKSYLWIRTERRKDWLSMVPLHSYDLMGCEDVWQSHCLKTACRRTSFIDITTRYIAWVTIAAIHRQESLKVAPTYCAVQRAVMSKWRRSPVESPIQVYADWDLITQQLSPNQPVYIDVAQERSQVFWT